MWENNTRYEPIAKTQKFFILKEIKIADLFIFVVEYFSHATVKRHRTMNLCVPAHSKFFLRPSVRHVGKKKVYDYASNKWCFGVERSLSVSIFIIETFLIIRSHIVCRFLHQTTFRLEVDTLNLYTLKFCLTTFCILYTHTLSRDLLGERKVFDEKVQKRLLKVLPV